MTSRGHMPRVLDSELAYLLGGLPAILVEGPKAVGKTATARRLCEDELLLYDQPGDALALWVDIDIT